MYLFVYIVKEVGSMIYTRTISKFCTLDLSDSRFWILIIVVIKVVFWMCYLVYRYKRLQKIRSNQAEIRRTLAAAEQYR